MLHHPVGDLVGILLQLVQIGADEVQVDIDLPKPGRLKRSSFLNSDSQVDIIAHHLARIDHHVELRIISLGKIDQPAVNLGLGHVPLPFGDAARRVADDGEDVRDAAQLLEPLFDLD